jgi:glycosyltransferase involved in cell wall biosynthesis
LRRWLHSQAASGGVDIMHSHSLWMMPNVYPGAASRQGTCKLVVSPRGTLSAWALRRRAVQKRVFWRLLQGPALRSAACFHATAESEYEDIRRMGFTQPLCVLPNGVDLPPLNKATTDGPRQLLFLGRIHPQKGVEVLVHAWHSVAERFPEWKLTMVGPGEPRYVGCLRALVAQWGTERIEFPGPLYGEDKVAAYRRASLFVLPTFSENFGMAVAESLASGTPVIVTRAAPWAGLEQHRAGWWIETGVDPLIACLEQALSMPPPRLEEMGRAGHAWMKRDFSWPRIGRQFLETYQWLLDGGPTPEWVRLN